jgi:hypothetical protein
VHTIVTAHLKGTISVESALGTGTTVSLWSPPVVPEQRNAPPS